MGIFETRDNTLYFDGVSTTWLAAEFGTPLYVFSKTEIVKRIAEIKKEFLYKHKNTRVAYASKAFLTLAMCRVVEEQGLSLDVVSGGELYTAIRAGFPTERIEFHGNNKSYAELEMAIEYGVGHIIIDAFDELSVIEELCERYGKTVKVLYRITPEVDADTHRHISTGGKGSKFGFSMEESVIYPLLKEAIDSEYVTLAGIHFHVGSQLFENAGHLQALKKALALFKGVRDRYGYELPEINVGGGFGIAYTSEDERKSFGYFLDPIMEETERFCRANGLTRPTIVTEPGRSIVGESGITLYTVGSVKEIEGVRTYVSVDGGMSDNIRPALYGAKYEGMIANKANAIPTTTVTVCGKCCESGDKLIKDALFVEAQRGDILAVFSTGAYGYSMANNYNKQPIPAAVMVEEGKARLIVKRQSYYDLIRNELLPEHDGARTLAVVAAVS
ncbi:MAG: diaminopimelate decarboxylase [Clostridiales Family XIII bacterium]|jgi:diaminopimelate decarboxylase|nr:diaminopimelate decarboxylase [Clostridiales Family XIII bacterium]